MERECWWWEWCHKRMEMKAVYGIGGSIKVMLARLIVVTGWVGRLEIDVRLLVVVVGVATLAAVVGGHKLAGGGDWRPEKERKMEWGLGTVSVIFVKYWFGARLG
ncbi:hypothetical protein Tco_0509631 [Tanacetum coccineum]|uniref:Uncharacterized protein n=1 Tax=Tanacetum coccineum TaxID=301880 RepID=A0ABQ5GKM2_9ASTR